ncbi:MAG: hypothetical protein KJ787_12010 [Gammaproteobacteria bacterium]|nr:hypothetical protein [Gammaproteobacteria bacterium]MBU1647047.1 hypothetical protein [Gammaproteobacteria bacterium]MBU1972559.1 hypothetical protein [Gammaproteobacteria bacterium]
MKKSIIAGAILAVCSVGASAAPEYSVVIGSGTFVMGDCPNHLADDPKILASTGVMLAASCIQGAPRIVLAGCHTAGLIKKRSAKVACDDDVTNGVTPTVPACDGTDPATPAGAPSGSNVVVGFEGATIMVANSGGGSLSGATVASGTTCDAAGVSVKAVVDAF